MQTIQHIILTIVLIFLVSMGVPAITSAHIVNYNSEEREAIELIFYSSGGDVNSVQELLDAGVNINAMNIHGSGVLHVMVGENNIGMMRFLLDRGADINIRNVYGLTPLIVAVNFDNADMVKLLLDYHGDTLIDSSGPDVDARTNNGWTALMLASYLSSVEIVKLLLNHGVGYINARNDERQTALGLATNKNIKKLLESHKAML